MTHPNEPAVVHAEDVRFPQRGFLARLPTIGAIVGLAGAVLSGLFAGGDPKQFYFSWLVSFLFFLSLALGGLYFVLIHTVMQGGWGVVVRRIGETVAGVLPVFALLFLPVLMGLQTLYSWAVPGAAEHDKILAFKAPFLNVNFFVLRAAIYLVVWSLIAFWFRRTSLRQDVSGDPNASARLRRWAGPCVIVLALTQTFAAFDWIMSLDPHWYSTIFGVYWFAGTIVSFFALQAIAAVALEKAGTFKGLLHAGHRQDLGKLVFAFTAFWAYIAFSQFFLIWYGNLPEETIWYQVRLHGSWKTISALLMVGHFILPFFYFIGRTTKRKPAALVAGSAWVLLMHWVDMHWLVMPVLHEEGFHLRAADITTFLAVGGFFLAAVGWLARRQALVPVRDPRLPESLSLDSA